MGLRAMAKGDMENGLKNIERAMSKKYELAGIGFMERGRTLEMARDYHGAIRQFTNAIEASPWSTAPLMARAGAYMELDEFEKAMQDFSKALEMGKSAEAYICRGVCSFCIGDMENALLDFTDALALDPKSRDGLICRSNVLSWMGMQEAALKDIDNAIGLMPGHDLSARKGIILLNIGRNDEALEALGTIPKDPGTLYLMAIAFEKLKRFGEAIRCLDEAIGLDKKNHVFYLARHEMRRTTGDIEGAEKDLSKGIALKEQNMLDANISASLALLGARSFDAALICASEAVKMRPNDADAYDLRASIHFASGNNKEAVEDYTKAISLAPRNADFYNCRSMVYYNLGEYVKALDDAEKALSMLPMDINFQYSKAQALIAMKRWEEAIAWLSRMIRRESDNDQLLSDRASCFFNQGRFSDAIRDYRAAIRANPEEPAYFNDIGYAFYMFDKYSQAISYFNKAIKAAEKEGNAYIKSIANTNIAFCYEELENYFEAMRHHNLAVEAAPKDASVYYNRAALREKLGDKEGARQDYNMSEDLESRRDEPPF
jgi:tetratricopeptide (TPR) repeat protein